MWTRVTDIVGPMWLAIFIIWAISGLTVKDTVGSKSDARARLLVWGVMLGWLLLFSPGLRQGLLGERFVAAVIGLGFALWARFAVGRNWGGLITVQKDHKVVRSGPYGIVRHPMSLA